MFFQHLHRAERYLRTAEPQLRPGQYFGNLCHQSLHIRNVPDITGNAKHIRTLPEETFHDLVLLLIDRILGDLHLDALHFRIGAQSVNRKVRMNVLCIDCR